MMRLRGSGRSSELRGFQIVGFGIWEAREGDCQHEPDRDRGVTFPMVSYLKNNGFTAPREVWR